MVKEFDSATVYLIENNKKCPFFNEEAFLIRGYQWWELEEIEDLSQIPTGDMIYSEEKIETKEPSDYIFKYNLSYGITASDVKNLQKYLNNNGYVLADSGPGSPGQETELFGSLTQKALIRFQKENKIAPAIGFLGPITRGVVNN